MSCEQKTVRGCRRVQSWIGLVFLALAGCQSLPPLHTPSGRPEVLIHGATKAEVMDAIITSAMDRGYGVLDQSDSMLVLAKNADDFASQFLFGSEHNVTPQKQLRCSVAVTSEGVRVVGNFSIVTNPGRAFASATPASPRSKAAHQIQDLFETIRDALEGRANPKPSAEGATESENAP